MEIILKEDIVNLGYKNDIVNVKSGYGRNYLIPTGKAIIASPSAKKMLAEELKQRAHKLEKIKKDAEAMAAKLEGVSLTIATKVSSFINTFNYKGFDLTLDFQFTWGVDVMQEYYHSTVARFLTNGIDRLYKEAWHPTLNPSGKEQAIRLNNFGQGANNQADDDWVCNGSYLRCNMIQLGYTFNPTLIKKIGLSSLRLYANVNNAFLITSKDYNGYDPDNSSRLGDNKWGANRQFFTYPRPRTFTFGLNVAF